MSSRKTFKYRIYPTKQQEQTLLFFLRRCRDLYNAGLEERRAFYQMRRSSLSCSTQINELPDLKQVFPAYQDVPSHVLQDVYGFGSPAGVGFPMIVSTPSSCWS